MRPEEKKNLQITTVIEGILGENHLLSNSFGLLFEEKVYSKDDYILREGSKIEKIGIITDGVVRLFSTDDSGNEYNIQFSMENHFVVGGFYPETRSDVNIHCITDVKLLSADFKLVFEFLKDNNLLDKFLENYLGVAHNRVLNKFIQFLRLDARQRYLLFLKEYPNLINRIPHYHVANFLGISTTQLSRIRNSLSKNKL